MISCHWLLTFIFILFFSRFHRKNSEKNLQEAKCCLHTNTFWCFEVCDKRSSNVATDFSFWHRAARTPKKTKIKDWRTQEETETGDFSDESWFTIFIAMQVFCYGPLFDFIHISIEYLYHMLCVCNGRERKKKKPMGSNQRYHDLFAFRANQYKWHLIKRENIQMTANIIGAMNRKCLPFKQIYISKMLIGNASKIHSPARIMAAALAYEVMQSIEPCYSRFVYDRRKT